jgi:hypothetical protein
MSPDYRGDATETGSRAEWPLKPRGHRYRFRCHPEPGGAGQRSSLVGVGSHDLGGSVQLCHVHSQAGGYTLAEIGVDR